MNVAGMHDFKRLAELQTAEIKRLNSINAHLLAALELIGGKDLGNGVVQVTDDPRTLREIARQAIAKATK